MGDMTLIPTGGNIGGEMGAAGVGGLIGGGLGSLLGRGLNGWGNDGWNNGFRNVEGVNIQSSIDTNAILGGISQLQQGQNTLGMTLVQGQNTTNTTVERAASSTYPGLTAQNTQGLLASVQGFAGLNTVIRDGTSQTVAAIGAADRGALERSFQSQLAAERCCC